MKYNHFAYLLTGISLFALASCGESKSQTDSTPAVQSQEEEIPTVDISEVYSRPVPVSGEYTANVEAFKTNNITSSAAARIKEIKVDVGSHVTAGQPVVVLDDVNIAQTRVRLDDAERELQRAKELLEIGAGTQQSYDRLKTERDAMQRQYDNLVENTILTSPVTGVVTARNYDAGDLPGQLPILTIEQLNPAKVIVNVSETDFAKVHRNMDVAVNLDVYGDETFNGKVHLIHPSVDPSSRTFTVEITIPNNTGRILPGMFARVGLNFGEAEHVVVPDRAVVKQSGSGNRYVYVLNPADNTVTYQRVELGQRLNNSYEILSGLDNGATVVTTGQVRLKDGSKVNPRRSTAAE